MTRKKLNDAKIELLFIPTYVPASFITSKNPTRQFVPCEPALNVQIVSTYNEPILGLP